jgi:hypothetical protein
MFHARRSPICETGPPNASFDFDMIDAALRACCNEPVLSSVHENYSINELRGCKVKGLWPVPLLIVHIEEARAYILTISRLLPAFRGQWILSTDLRYTDTRHASRYK